MAISLPSPITGAVSGRLGSIVFVYKRQGGVIRAHGRTPFIGSTKQITQAAKMQTARLRWQIISDAERLQWETISATFIARDRLARRHRLSGFQLFCKVNGLSPVFDTAFYDAPPLSFQRINTGDFGLNFSDAAGWQIQAGINVLALGAVYLIWMARPVSTKKRKAFRHWVPCGSFTGAGPTFQVRALCEPVIGTIRVSEFVGVRLAVHFFGEIPGRFTEATTTMAV